MIALNEFILSSDDTFSKKKIIEYKQCIIFQVYFFIS